MGRWVVHGAWHGAWAWERVLALLASVEVQCTAVNLPGHGEDGGSPGDLHAVAARVWETIDAFDEGVVLVGHSYGGTVITDGGAHPGVEHLSTSLPSPLTSASHASARRQPRRRQARFRYEGRPNLGAGFVTGLVDLITLDPASAAECLYNDCDAASVAWAVSLLGPQPLIGWQESPKAVAWQTKPSTFAVCTNDTAVHPDLQRVMAQRCRTVIQRQTDHSLFLCRPDLVAALLMDLASDQPL